MKKKFQKNTKTLKKFQEKDILSFVIFEEDEIVQDNLCVKKPKIINYDDDNYTVCMRPSKNTRDAEEWGNIKIEDWAKEKKHIIEELELWAVFAYTQKRGSQLYFVKDNFIFLITRRENEILVERIAIPENIGENEKDIEEFIEEETEIYFEGVAKWRITETIGEIKERVHRENTAKTIILILLTMALALFIFRENLQDTPEILRTPPPKPKTYPLSKNEKNILKRGAALKLLKNLKEEVELYEDTNLSEIRRVVGLRVSKIKMIPPVKPKLKEKRKWVYPPGPKRGGVKLKTTKIYQQEYPGVGYSKQGKGVFSKTSKEEIFYDEKYLKTHTSEFKGIYPTAECVEMFLGVSESLFPIKRSKENIEIFLKKIKPHKVEEKITPLIQKCPVYIKDLKQEAELLTIKLVFYKESEKK